MTWKHWTALLLALAVLAFVIGFSGSARGQERLFGEAPSLVIIEAFANLERPTDIEFGLGLVMAWEGNTAVVVQRNGIIRNETCGAPLGCIKFVDGACILYIEQDLPENVEEAILRRLYADCAQ